MTTPTARDTGQHTIDYRILNFDLADPDHTVAVHATPDEIAQFARDGYLVRERLFQGAELGCPRAAFGGSESLVSRKRERTNR